MVEGGCFTPCKKEGELSGRGNVREEHVRGNTSRGKCPDARFANQATILQFIFITMHTIYRTVSFHLTLSDIWVDVAICIV